MKAKPFEQGQVLGGYRVDALDYLGINAETTRYRVTSMCCGTETIRTHTILHDAEKKNQKACKPCAERAYQEQRRARTRRHVGEIVAFYEVLEVVGDGYRVRTTCCQSELIKSHKQVTQASYQGMACCRPCRDARLVIKKEEEVPVIQDTRQVWCLETQGIISAALAWPRPASLRVSA